VNKNKLDVVQVFQYWLTFSGDATRVAVALSIPREDVEALAKAEEWSVKLREWSELKESGPDVQISLNRAVNYVQSSRLRAVLDKLVTELGTKTAQELIELCSVRGKDGAFGSLNFRAITDLTKASEAVQLMTMRSLGDTPAEQPEAKERKGSAIALSVQAALNAGESLGISSMDAVKLALNAPAKPALALPES
jgi:hypothetical protein